jgi:hypothetical protein
MNKEQGKDWQRESSHLNGRVESEHINDYNKYKQCKDIK